MKIEYRPDTKENRIEDLMLFKKHYTFSAQLYKKAMAAVKKGYSVSLTLNEENHKVTAIKIIHNKVVIKIISNKSAMAKKIVEIKKDKQGVAQYCAKKVYFGDNSATEMDIVSGEVSVTFSKKQTQAFFELLNERFDSAQKKRISELEKELRELREELDNKGMERDFEL